MKPAVVDPACCPLCGAPNQCALETGRASGRSQPPCWCARATFAPELLERVAATARRQACICHACAAQAAAPQS